MRGPLHQLSAWWPRRSRPERPERPQPAEAPIPLPPVDTGQLRERCLYKPGLIEKVLDRFMTQSRELLAAMSAGCQAEDATAASRAAHMLKGSAAYVAAEPVRALSEQIERLAREGDLAAAQKQLRALHQEVDRCLDYLVQVRAQNPSWTPSIRPKEGNPCES